jgi:hypothetical protein
VRQRHIWTIINHTTKYVDRLLKAQNRRTTYLLLPLGDIPSRYDYCRQNCEAHEECQERPWHRGRWQSGRASPRDWRGRVLLLTWEPVTWAVLTRALLVLLSWLAPVHISVLLNCPIPTQACHSANDRPLKAPVHPLVFKWRKLGNGIAHVSKNSISLERERERSLTSSISWD